MGQKVNPVGYRVGVYKESSSIWCAPKKEYVESFHEDLKIIDYVKKRLSRAMVSKVKVYRKSSVITVEVNTARPGQVIGKKGIEIDKLRDELNFFVNKNRKTVIKVFINVNETKKMWLDAELVGKEIARQISHRIPFKRAMKFAIRNSMKEGSQGIKIQCSGRLGGAEMARTERYSEGRIPLHTIRADIDYALIEAHTTYGVIGVKVWIYKGEIL